MPGREVDRQELDELIDARRRRLADSNVFSAGGSVLQVAAVVASGFEPVGHVFGSTVLHVGNLGSRARCSGTQWYSGRTDLASSNGPFQGLRRRLEGARRLTLSRAVAECVVLRGDGVLDARLTLTEHGPGTVEFTLQGTAVRARGRRHLEQPFSTHVSGSEFAALVEAGWVPVSVAYGVAVGSRHDDMTAVRRTRKRLGAAGNGEVVSYTRLVNDIRRDARNLLEKAVRGFNGDGVVVGEMTLRIGERECPTIEGMRDHVAEAVIAGTALAAFTPSTHRAGVSPLTVTRLDARATDLDAPAAPAHVRLETAEQLVDHPSLSDRAASMWRFRQARKDPFSRNQGD